MEGTRPDGLEDEQIERALHELALNVFLRLFLHGFCGSGIFGPWRVVNFPPVSLPGRIALRSGECLPIAKQYEDLRKKHQFDQSFILTFYIRRL